MKITPTRLPGPPAARLRGAAVCLHLLRRGHHIPPWQGVSLVMPCAAAAMVVMAPGPLSA